MLSSAHLSSGLGTNSRRWPYDLRFNLGVDSLDPRIAWTRASKAWDYNSSGNLEENANNVAPFDYNPSTLIPRGLLVSSQRTNRSRNPRCEGATVGVIGAGGALATYQAAVGTSAGINVELVGTGTENGFTYEDVRFFGTATSTTQTQIQFDGSVNMVAAAADYFCSSVFVRRVAGTNTSINQLLHSVIARNGGGTSIGSNAVDILATIGVAKLPLNRTEVALVMPALTAFVQHDLRIDYTSGAVIDITLRIAAPQCENTQGGFALGPIFPAVGTPASATRSGDFPTISDLSTIGYIGTGFTVFGEIEVQQVNGVMQWRLWELDDGANVCNVRCDGSSKWVATHGAVSVTGPTITTGIHKVAASFGAAGVILSVDGVDYATATPITPVTHTRMTLMGSTLTTDRQARSWLRRFGADGRQLVAAELNIRTAA